MKRRESLRGRELAIRYSQREATRLKMKEHVLWLFGPTRLVRRVMSGGKLIVRVPLDAMIGTSVL